MPRRSIMGRPAAKPNVRLARILKRSKYPPSALAKKLGVSRQAVHWWMQWGVPAERVLAVAMALPCAMRDLRPDIYPK
jgi:DNA invertase Pin-like site-specific DNA recombinase